MTYFQISPHICGCFGDDTDIQDIYAFPTKFSNFHFELTIWPEADLITAGYDAYAGTTRLADAIKKAGLTGVEFDHVEMVDGDQFYKYRKQHAGEELPDYLWFKFTGKPGIDDFGQIQTVFPLVVSERALNLLKTFDHKHFRIKDFDPSLLPANT